MDFITYVSVDRRALLSSRVGVGAEDTSCSSDGGGEEAAAERIARYKEERRRQMAARFGSRTEEGAPRRYITRNGGGGVSDHSTLAVRTTRTSRLRAAGVSPTESSHGSVSPRKEGSSPRHKELSVSRSAASSPSTPSVHMNGVGSGVATRVRRVGMVEPLQRRRNNAATTSSDKEKISVPSSELSTKSSPNKQEKDKSSKRKSNLNCSSTTEEVVTNDLIEERCGSKDAPQSIFLCPILGNDGLCFCSSIKDKKVYRKCTCTCVEGEGKINLGKTTLTTPNRDSNLDIPAINSLVYCESSVADHAGVGRGYVGHRLSDSRGGMLARAPSSSITRDVPAARRRADHPPALSLRQQVAAGDGPPPQEFPGCNSGKKNSLASARNRAIPTEWPSSVGGDLVPSVDRGCHVVSTTNPQAVSLSSLGRSR
uniref:Uncharacterized protein n=1 Tax=Timema bartmani TaxID=61472 RepID=A0A7R9EMP3_9NEOP|nr:unnamed protein product [Timema bartmani]